MPSRSPRRLSTPRTARLVVAYDGTRYAGWQRQRNAPTIQATLEAALRQLSGRRVTAIAAGRTDAGVHAWGQVVHARLRTRLSPGTLRQALNAILPPDIVIRHAHYVPGTFHARYDAARKWYRYRILESADKPLFDRWYVHRVPQRLHLSIMQRAAQAWVGRHDFRAFHSNGRPVDSTRRTVHRLRISRQGREVRIDVEADGFLYHMVRRMVGMLLEIGRGRRPAIAPTAPAKGLCLMRVSYAKGARPPGARRST